MNTFKKLSTLSASFCHILQVDLWPQWLGLLLLLFKMYYWHVQNVLLACTKCTIGMHKNSYGINSEWM